MAFVGSALIARRFEFFKGAGGDVALELFGFDVVVKRSGEQGPAGVPPTDRRSFEGPERPGVTSLFKEFETLLPSV